MSDNTETKSNPQDIPKDSSDPKSSSSYSSPYFKTIFHEIFFIMVICSVELLTEASKGQAMVVAIDIGNSFGVDNHVQLSWFSAAFSLTFGAFIFPAGRIGDIYGHKPVLLVACFLYSLASMVAGLTIYTKSEAFFIICRAIQGLTAAFMVPCSLAIVGMIYEPGKKKNMVMAIFGACAPNGFLIGGLFASVLTEQINWQWSFYILAIVTALMGLGSAYFIPEKAIILSHSLHVSHNPNPEKQQFDYWGALIGVGALICFNTAWNQAPVVGWTTPYIYCLLIIGLVALVAFSCIELYIAKQPLIPSGVFNLQIFTILVCVALGWASFGIWVWYLIQFLQVLRQVSPLMTVVMWLPASPSGILASFLAGWLVRKLHASWLMVLSLLGFMIPLILVATQPVDQTYWGQTFMSIFLMSFGIDLNFTAAIIIISDFLPKAQQGVAASLINTIVNESQSIGFGVAGTVVLYFSPDSKTLLYYRSAWYTGIGFCGIGILITFIWMSLRKLNHKDKNNVQNNDQNTDQNNDQNDDENDDENNYHSHDNPV